MLSPLLKMVILAIVTFAMTPAWSFDPSSEDEPEIKVKDYAITGALQEVQDNPREALLISNTQAEQSLESLEEIETEKVFIEVPTQEFRVAEKVQNGDKKELSVEIPEVIKTADTKVLSSLGIKRLAKGISIFRFSSFYLKTRSPLAKSRTLPQNPVQ